MNATLTDKQINYMEFIHHYIAENDNFPSYAVVGKHFGVNPGAVQGHLNALEKKGYLEMCENMQRYRRTHIFKNFMIIRENNKKVAA